MDFGLFNLMMHRDNPRGIPGVVDDARSMVETADAAGFGVAWFAEHHFTNYSLSVSPLMMASHLAGVTKRIKVGPCVVVLPLHNPLRAAQEIALLDQQSGGRAMLGLGSGYQAYEFDRFGTPIAHKTEVFLEYWDVMRQALVDGQVSYEGRHISVPETVVAIRPVQQPMPPLFLTSLHPAVLARFAADGAVPFVSGGAKGNTAGRVASRDAALKSWAACGLDPATMPVALMNYICVTDSASEALEAAERGRYYARMVHALRAPVLDLAGSVLHPAPIPDEPSLEEFRDNFIIGDVHHVAERVIQDIRLLDPVHYTCFFQFGDMPVGRARRSLERFAAEVIPLVAREVGPLDRIGLRPPREPSASAA
ncbi:LLM class flavin-dependent oxidoreductase [Methylobacterium terricola]|uniref:LLM class flavin-dependent oxidoreductase n=1 Tax=Methylobacterium terricola TaxID=2583531 RepID=A0A5C4L994_9HYPH|nr:LLM class flavin-dependent oxidoreductase [Methylobacterium terricola]TNC07298.1 LLM class flavin-dependent oxidoreductase [Methylobacterium terricola]